MGSGNEPQRIGIVIGEMKTKNKTIVFFTDSVRRKGSQRTLEPCETWRDEG